MERPTPPPSESATSQNATSWVLQILVALVLGATAIAKLTGQADSIEVFENLGMEPTGRHIIGLLELTAALLLLIPLSVPWGAILAWGVMSGALIAHFTRLGFTGPLLPMAMAAGFIWVASAVILFFRRRQVEFIRTMFDCHGKKREPHE